MERGKVKKERERLSTSSREPVKLEKDKRRSVVEVKGKEKGKEEEKRRSVELKARSGKEKGRDVGQKHDNVREKGKDEEKKKDVGQKHDSGKDKGKDEEKKKDVGQKHDSGKDKGKDEKKKSVDLKNKENGKKKEVKKEQGTEKEKEQVKESSNTSIRTLYPPPGRDPGPGPAPRRPSSAPDPDPPALLRGTTEEKNKQILVLGLDEAGKTSILQSLASNRVQHSMAPTEGFNAVYINAEDQQLEFLEIGGSEPFRSSWNTYLPNGWLLIFVVDSADHKRLPEAKKCLHQLIESNPELPLVVFANKQDLHAAYHITDIHDALALSEVGNDRKLFLFGTQVTENGSEIPSTMQDAKDLIAHLATDMEK